VSAEVGFLWRSLAVDGRGSGSDVATDGAPVVPEAVAAGGVGAPVPDGPARRLLTARAGAVTGSATTDRTERTERAPVDARAADRRPAAAADLGALMMRTDRGTPAGVDFFGARCALAALAPLDGFSALAALADLDALGDFVVGGAVGSGWADGAAGLGGVAASGRAASRGPVGG
jgi:hypothetical protein